VLLYEAAQTVVHAFIVSGVFALSAITVLLLITLRRIGDVLLTLIPLLVAGVVTLELCVILGIPLNFANIIALPLLLGVGVAFKIYYIMAWRAGKTSLLQSSLTRAVIFSAMTTAAAFGSLWLSENPGTSSMGKMMALALLCTMAAAVFFQPPAQNSRFSFERRGTEGLKSGRLPSGSIAKPSSTPGAPRARLPVWRRGRQGHGEPGSARLFTQWTTPHSIPTNSATASSTLLRLMSGRGNTLLQLSGPRHAAVAVGSRGPRKRKYAAAIPRRCLAACRT
jgi:hypothetical protein